MSYVYFVKRWQY